MSNGEVCCILGVCCPPASAKQRADLVEQIQKHRPQMSRAQAEAAADRVLIAHDYFRGVAKAIDEA